VNHSGRLLLAVAGLVASVSPASGATFTVDTTADAADATPGDGACATSTGACTLRAAVQESNALAGADAIILPAGTCPLSLGQIDLQSDLAITGAGASVTTIDGNHLGRVLEIEPGSTAALVGLSLANGTDPASLGAKGGCVLNAGTLTITDSVVRHCAIAAVGAEGAAIHNTGTLDLVGSTVRDSGITGSLSSGGGITSTGVLALTDSIVRNNAVPVGIGTFSVGGGIASTGALTLTRSTVRDNRADSGGGISTAGTADVADSTVRDNEARHGGGIVNSGTLWMNGTTISGNSADGGLDGSGGGILNTGTVTLTNSTVSGNEVRGTLSAHGAGLVNADTLTSVHSTVNDNTAQTDVFDPAARTGGLFNSGTASLTATIVGNSFGADCRTLALPAAIASLGHNLDTDGSCGLTGNGDLSAVDPLLGPLLNNGGATLTHALLAGSPAVDAAPGEVCPASDQRGIPRPQGSECDIGAYELVRRFQRADLQLAKTADAEAVRPGDELVYTLVVANGGPDPASRVTVADRLPQGVTFVGVRSSQGRCTPRGAGRGTTVTCALGDLPADGEATVSIAVIADAPGLLYNSARMTGTVIDPDLANNRAVVRTPVQAR
jgi:uncharacterized repeat protein (TIGR01451 family)/CSLREA domain-containing protein